MQALDKIRFLALTDQSQLGEGDDAKLDIHVSWLYRFNSFHLCSNQLGVSTLRVSKLST
jgi:hypothetical protein